MGALILAAILAGNIVIADRFDRPDGPLPAPWTATQPGWGIESERVRPPITRGTSAAVRRVGRAQDISVTAKIRLSPSGRRANAGLVFLWRSYRNHLFCKAEVTEGNPTGLLTIGRTLHGQVTSLLAPRAGLGLRSGESYRMRMHRRGDIVSCKLTRGNLAEPVRVQHRLGPDELERLGSVGKAGFRIRVEIDEDDGRSRFDNFIVRR